MRKNRRSVRQLQLDTQTLSIGIGAEFRDPADQAIWVSIAKPQVKPARNEEKYGFQIKLSWFSGQIIEQH
ncbi:hypothetical protein AAGQ96_20030 [Pantoea sp. MBD-2R]|uniref:hypothetical protein n=1 Tax=unclassified Pantoea TaxID=2630326 RepID=UPI0011BF13CA|nr:hypothetical protein [Pantoea sp. CCBC3-3-1]